MTNHIKVSSTYHSFIFFIYQRYVKLFENVDRVFFRTPIPEDDAVEEPRFIRIDREQPSEPLGIGIIGGNSLGIYISDIQKDSLAGHQAGLKCGDKILKVCCI